MPRAEHKYLNIADLRRLRNVLFSSRRPVEGLYAGRHASRQRGQSVEFSDYRQYMPGDPASDIDWKVFGRTDKLFVKLFEHQSEMSVHLIVDASASMAYRGIPEVRRRKRKLQVVERLHSKYDHACRLAASIAFLTTQQQDRVSCAFAQNGLHRMHEPKGTPDHLLNILDTMERVSPQGEAELSNCIEQTVRRIPRRGLLVLLSDLHEQPKPVLDALSSYTATGGEIVVFHVLHNDEIRLPDLQDAMFTDSESGRKLNLNIADVRDEYEQRVQRFLQGWLQGCQGRGFDYQRVLTQEHYHKALEHYLFARASVTG